MKKTKETVETSEDTCKYKIVWRERPKETKETVEIIKTRDTCEYKLYRDTERDQRDCRDCGYQWRNMQNTKLYGELETEGG